jgi:RNA polymerase sigma-70 factor (ECF subfamily)
VADFADELLHHAKKLRSYALRLTRNADRADDLMQDVLARALERQHQFQTGSNMAGWLTTICRNEFITQTTRKRHLMAEPDDLVIEMLPAKDDPEAALAAKQVFVRLNDLPAPMRDTLVLYGLGHEYEEMAALQAVPVGTIKSRVHRGQKRLAELTGYEG